jgi:biopolymer transport protein ExbB/TolQ
MKNAITSTLREGGIVLWALLVLAVMIYALAAAVWWHCAASRRRVRDREWAVTAGEDVDRRQVEREFAACELDEMAWIERRLPFLGVLIGAAPLLGLLGTVAGMLVTFGGMSMASGGAPIDTVSAGISKALVTTQAGLVIAVPAAFLFALLKRAAETTHRELQRQLHERLAAWRNDLPEMEGRR